jgi:hypothetical protein
MNMLRQDSRRIANDWRRRRCGVFASRHHPNISLQFNAALTCGGGPAFKISRYFLTVSIALKAFCSILSNFAPVSQSKYSIYFA